MIGLILKRLLRRGIVELPQKHIEAFGGTRLLIEICDERGEVRALLFEDELVKARGIGEADGQCYDHRGSDRDEEKGEGEFT